METRLDLQSPQSQLSETCTGLLPNSAMLAALEKISPNWILAQNELFNLIFIEISW